MSEPNSLIQQSESFKVEPARDERRAFWDQFKAAVTKWYGAGTTANSRAPYGWLALLIITNAVVSTLSGAHDLAQRGAPYDLGRPAFFEGTGAAGALVLLPMLRSAVHLLDRCRHWVAKLAIASLIVVFYSIAHTIILVASRKIGFAAVGGSYNFNWLSQGLYEFRRDIVAAMVLGGAFWLFDRRAAVASGPSTQEAEPQAEEPYLWLRDGTTAVRVDPRAIVTVTSAGNYVEFSLTDKNYLIRGTLAGEEMRLRPFGLRRVHRTRLANLDRVVAVEPRSGGEFVLRMDDGRLISGSRRYRDAVTIFTESASGRTKAMAGSQASRS